MFLRLTQQIVALKETRLKEDEGAPFTAIREGEESSVLCLVSSHSLLLVVYIVCVKSVEIGEKHVDSLKSFELVTHV